MTPVGAAMLVMLIVDARAVPVGVDVRVALYQFCTGSPRQSPTVTPLRPLWAMIRTNSGVRISAVFWWICTRVSQMNLAIGGSKTHIVCQSNGATSSDAGLEVGRTGEVTQVPVREVKCVNIGLHDVVP